MEVEALDVPYSEMLYKYFKNDGIDPDVLTWFEFLRTETDWHSNPERAKVSNKRSVEKNRERRNRKRRALRRMPAEWKNL